jgi:hypothetical protein
MGRRKASWAHQHSPTLKAEQSKSPPQRSQVTRFGGMLSPGFGEASQSHASAPPFRYSMTRVSKKFFSFFHWAVSRLWMRGARFARAGARRAATVREPDLNPSLTGSSAVI